MVVDIPDGLQEEVYEIYEETNLNAFKVKHDYIKGVSANLALEVAYEYIRCFKKPSIYNYCLDKLFLTHVEDGETPTNVRECLIDYYNTCKRGWLCVEYYQIISPFEKKNKKLFNSCEEYKFHLSLLFRIKLLLKVDHRIDLFTDHMTDLSIDHIRKKLNYHILL